MYKQVIILRKDLEMSTGKKCVQSCHACLGSYKKASKSVINKWNSEGQKKVVLEIDSKEKILKLYEKAKEKNIACFLVQDAGLTQLDPGTITALGLGPEDEKKIDKITGNLKLF
jgi:PTH2 family peptidyl-tRNA hydrolase